jgi:transposase-like protein
LEEAMARKGKWSVEQKTEMVLSNLRGEVGVSELARKHGIAGSQIHTWKADFLSAGQAALGGTEGKAETKQLEAQVEKLEQMLGRKVVELEIAKKARSPQQEVVSRYRETQLMITA